ncbi:NicO-domain-containing protein [Mycena metata]|uniref:Nickel/cobalt efflux system n=1 Tax=Mycena metata TaxID=1033252 RepID=A0AAD7KFI8_9AGAR|nr:NicO-domain-containing protein [Mycena metata]
MLSLSLFGRSLLLVSSLLLFNAFAWILAGIFFGPREDTQPILGLALLAWTLGLRHALDADHISAIDNATRSLINLGQLPVTCGLFFSLGHSTIVIIVNVAIAISSTIYHKLGGVGSVGGVVGSAVSGSFLFIVGFANSIILWRILRRRRRAKRRAEQGLEAEDDEINPHQNHMLMMRLLGPVITFVNRPWKVVPTCTSLHLLIDLRCFDTASSIALLAVSALAHKKSDGSAIPSGQIVVLPLLFTAGMTLIDSADSILMLYSYAGFPESSQGWAIRDRKQPLPDAEQRNENTDTPVLPTASTEHQEQPQTGSDTKLDVVECPEPEHEPSTNDAAPAATISNARLRKQVNAKANVMSGLSIILTLLSILVAFSISLITIMALIGDSCTPCQDAANDPDGGGLAGRWWRAWDNANDNSGYIGAAIVGAFVVIVAGWYVTRRVLAWRARGRHGAGLQRP